MILRKTYRVEPILSISRLHLHTMPVDKGGKITSSLGLRARDRNVAQTLVGDAASAPSTTRPTAADLSLALAKEDRKSQEVVGNP